MYQCTMDPCLKLYYPDHKVNSKIILQDYFSQHIPYSLFKETTINLMRCFYKVFRSGLVHGKTMIDISLSPIIAQLISVCEFFEEISILKFNDTSIKELKLWRNKDPAAFDWTQTSKLFMELKGINSDRPEDKNIEEILRCKIKQILKWEFCNDNLVDLLSLPKADCVTSIWALEMVSKDHEDYRRNLRKFSNLIKPGGYLLLFADINASYFKVGEQKFHLLPCDECFYRKVICEEGFEIKHFEKLDRIICSDIVDHEEVVFIIGQKVRKA